MDILAKLKDLHSQATKERSHYYVGATVNEAIEEIERLRGKRVNRNEKAKDRRRAEREIMEWVKNHIG